MSENPETTVTKRIRKLMELHGAYFVKLSDTFTRGIPDVLVATNRIMLIEIKVDRSKGTLTTRSYKSLGLTGAQDSRIRNFYRRSGDAIVMTDTEDGGRLRVWIPIDSDNEGPGFEDYSMMHIEGTDDFLVAMGLT